MTESKTPNTASRAAITEAHAILGAGPSCFASAQALFDELGKNVDGLPQEPVSKAEAGTLATSAGDAGARS